MPGSISHEPSCYCSSDDYEWWYIVGDDTEPAEQACVCNDCGSAIAAGDYVQRMEVFEFDEESGDDVQKEDFLMCEKCTDTFYNLRELDFCLTMGEGAMAEAMREYLEMRS